MQGPKGFFPALHRPPDGRADADRLDPAGRSRLATLCAGYCAAGDPPGAAAIKGAIRSRLAPPRGSTLRGRMSCPRCAAPTCTIYVMCRPLGDGERRVCDRCLPRSLAEGLLVSATDDIALFCNGCWSASRPSHVVSREPAPTTARCCEDCKHALAAEGWRAAVVMTRL